MRDLLLRVWVVLCVAIVLAGAAWWLRDGWPATGGTDSPEAEVVLLEDHTGVAADGGTVHVSIGVLATTPGVIRERPDVARIDVGLTVGTVPSTTLSTPDGQEQLRSGLLARLRASYPDAGVEQVLVTDLVIGPPAPPENLADP